MKSKKYQYEYGYYMTTDQLITLATNKYDIWTKTKKWNLVYPAQEKTIKITSVVKNMNENNLILASKSNKK